jgi:hypothetical protein
MLRIDEGLLDKNWRPSQKTVVKTKVYLREQVAELNRKVGIPVILTQRAVINKTVFINLEIRAILMVLFAPTRAYSPSVRLRRRCTCGAPREPEAKNASTLCCAFSRFTCGSQVSAQSPSHSTRNSMLPCSSSLLFLMDLRPILWLYLWLAFFASVTHHVIQQSYTIYHATRPAL